MKDRTVTDLILKLVCEYNRPCKPWLSIRRDLLNLLCLLGVKAKKNSIGHKGFAVIQKGIEYLQKDEKQTLSIEEIAKLCFVTPAYFRRIFREYSGMSPTEYRMRMKIERAKDLMERSEQLLRDGVCDLVGYGRMWLAYPTFYRDHQNGMFNPKKCCPACSKCTELMRAKQVSGCAVFHEYYRTLYKQTCM